MAKLQVEALVVAGLVRDRGEAGLGGIHGAHLSGGCAGY